MKIAYVISSLGGGGAERMLVNLVNALPSDFEIHIIALKAAGKMASHLTHPNVQVHPLHFRSHRDLLGWFRFLRLLRKIRPDVVHSHMTLSNLACRAAKLILRIPVVVNHEHGLGTWKSRALCRLDGLTQRLASRVITVSEASRRIRMGREGISADRIVAIPNAIEWNRWSTVEKSKQRDYLSIGVAASLTPVKRIDLALRIVSELHAVRRNVRLLIAGDGPERPRLEATTRELGIEACVQFLGFQQDMAQFYSQVDVVMLTSLREDCPMALLEALAAGKFVVGPCTGGTPEILQPPVEGIVLEDANNLGTLIERLSAVPTSFDSSVNREYAKRFDVGEYAQRIATLYESLGKRPNRQAKVLGHATDCDLAKTVDASQSLIGMGSRQ